MKNLVQLRLLIIIVIVALNVSCITAIEPLNDTAFDMLKSKIVNYPIRYVLIADPHTKNGTYNDFFIPTLNEIAEADPDFVICLGDLTNHGYSGEITEFYSIVKDWMEQTSIPFFSLPGNHDFYSGAQGYTGYNNYIGEQTYYFDYGNIRFILFNNVRQNYNDPPDDYKISDTDFALIDGLIKNYRGNVFTFCHIPFSRESYASCGAYFSGSCDEEIVACDGCTDLTKAEPLFLEFHNNIHKKYGVRANFSGHLHMYYYDHLDAFEYFVISTAGNDFWERTYDYSYPYTRILDNMWLTIIVDEHDNVKTEMHVLNKSRTENLAGGVTAADYDVFIQPAFYSDNILEKSDLNYRQGQLFYARDDGYVCATYKLDGNLWNTGKLCTTAPKMKSTTGNSVGIDVVPGCSDIYYVASNQRIYKIYHNGSSWSWSYTNPSAYARLNSEIHYGNEQIFYIDINNRLHALYQVNGQWVYDWLNGSAPVVTPGSGFALIPEENNKIFYVARINNNNKIYQIYWNGSGWTYEPTSSSTNIRSDTELHYGNDQLFYVDNYGRLCALYKSGSSWLYGYLNYSAPKVKTGTGFDLVPEQNNTLYYVGADDNIYKIYWAWNPNGWTFEKINNSFPEITKGKANHDLIFSEDQIFYVSNNDAKVHRLNNNNTIPFSVTGSNVGEQNNWNVSGTDGADVAYKLYLPATTTLTATLCDPYTNFDTKLEVFNLDGTSTFLYNDDYSCSYNNTASTLSNKTLSAGCYYLVVDGYNGKTGNYHLSVTKNISKSTSQGNNSSNSNTRYKYEINELSNRFPPNQDIAQIYPNPFTSKLNIKLSEPQYYVLKILNVQGKLIKLIKGTGNNIELELTDIQSGFYIIEINLKDCNKFFKVQKLNHL